MWRLLLIFVFFCVSAVPTFAQDEVTDFDRLMAGEEIALDWESGVVWGEDPLNEEMSPAAELLREFVQQFVNEEDQDFALRYVWGQILIYAAPEMTFEWSDNVWLGLNVTTARWDAETQTLYLQASRYLPATRPDGEPNGIGCGGGWGFGDDTILWTEVNECVSTEERSNGFDFMPTTTVYRMGVFTVEYLPPTE